MYWLDWTINTSKALIQTLQSFDRLGGEETGKHEQVEETIEMGLLNNYHGIMKLLRTPLQPTVPDNYFEMKIKINFIERQLSMKCFLLSAVSSKIHGNKQIFYATHDSRCFVALFILLFSSLNSATFSSFPDSLLKQLHILMCKADIISLLSILLFFVSDILVNLIFNEIQVLIKVIRNVAISILCNPTTAISRLVFYKIWFNAELHQQQQYYLN